MSSTTSFEFCKDIHRNLVNGTCARNEQRIVFFCYTHLLNSPRHFFFFVFLRGQNSFCYTLGNVFRLQIIKSEPGVETQHSRFSFFVSAYYRGWSPLNINRTQLRHCPLNFYFSLASPFLPGCTGFRDGFN